MSLLDKIKSLFDDRQATIKAGLSEKEVETTKEKLISGMLIDRPKFDPARLQWFSEEQEIDLGTAHTNLEIWNRGGRGIFVTFFNGDPDNTKFRFNDKVSALYPIRLGYTKGAFNNLYLTNTAQTGRTLKFVIGYRNFAEFQMLMQDRATEPIIYKVTMTTGNTEYEQALPNHTKKLRLLCADGTIFRFAFVTGQVATPGDCMYVIANEFYQEDNLDLIDKTLYVACTDAAKVACILCWV